MDPVRELFSPGVPQLGTLGAAVYQDLHYVAEKDRTDSWLVFSPAGTPPAKEWWSPARQKLFLGALALVEKDPIRVVMKSNFAVSDKTVAMARAGREKSRGVGAAAALDIAERVNRAKWIGIRMDVGNRPTATISAEMSSVADAFAVQLTYNNKVLPDMITRAKERDRKARQKAEEEEEDEEYDPKITALQMAETFKAAFRMERNEELLTIRLSSLDMQRLSASLLATVEDLIGKITAETIDSLFEEDSPDPES